MVQKLHKLAKAGRGSRSKGLDRGESRDCGGPRGELVMVDVCLVLCPWPRPLLLAAYATPGKLWPVLCRALAELPDLMPRLICQTLQVIHTALYNLLKLA